MPDNRPVDRLQAFLAAIAGDESAPELTPRDQMEYYLAKMAERIGNIQPGTPLYPIPNGTYTQTQKGETNIIVSGSHMTVDHVSSTGNGPSEALVTFPDSAIQGQHTVVFKISNYTETAAATCTLKIGQLGHSTAVDIVQLTSGNGEYTANTNFQTTTNVLYLSIPWSRAYQCEFDFEFYVDGVRWC